MTASAKKVNKRVRFPKTNHLTFIRIKKVGFKRMQLASKAALRGQSVFGDILYFSLYITNIAGKYNKTNVLLHIILNLNSQFCLLGSHQSAEPQTSNI